MSGDVISFDLTDCKFIIMPSFTGKLNITNMINSEVISDDFIGTIT